jgi:hypothetical protein
VHCELIYKLYQEQQICNSAFYVFDCLFAAICFGEISILMERGLLDMNDYCNIILLRRNMWEQILIKESIFTIIFHDRMPEGFNDKHFLLRINQYVNKLSTRGNNII